MKEAVYVDSRNRQVAAWVSGLMNVATFKRYAKRIIKKGKSLEVVIIDDQTDDAKYVQDLETKEWNKKNSEDQVDYWIRQMQPRDKKRRTKQ